VASPVGGDPGTARDAGDPGTDAPVPVGGPFDWVAGGAAAAGEAMEVSDAGESDCTFTTGADGFGRVINARLEDEGVDTIDVVKESWPEGGQDISGVGDRAYWADQVNALYATEGRQHLRGADDRLR
jgi:hypothetical protein